jgi:hypothetical protein
MIMKFCRKKNLLLVIFSAIITFAPNSEAKKSKLERIAPPHIDLFLSKYHFNDPKPENIFGYGKDKYIILTAGYPTTIFDMEGKVLKSWDHASARAKLRKNCNLVYIEHHKNDQDIFNRDTYIKEFDKKDNIVWQYEDTGFAHHDFEITDEGHFIFFFSIDIPDDFELTSGCDRDLVIGDKIIEVDKEGKKHFEWNFYDHFKEVINGDRCTAKRLESIRQSNFINKLDPIHPNGLQVLKDNKWYRKGYKEFKPGNILVTVHHLSSVFIIERETQKVVWVYKGEKDEPLNGPHEARMIPEGLPGAGNIFVHDNGNTKVTRGYSRILEIHPITKKTIWKYQKPGEFFNEFAGTQQRLKDGKTFISEDYTKRAFIVNKKGETIWQFVGNNLRQIKRPQLLLKKDYAHCLKD